MLSQMFSVDPFNVMTGYKSKTTFWSDFSIAERFGTKGIQDTYNVSVNSYKDNIEYMAELVLTLNHKIWTTYENPQLKEISSLYNELWQKAVDLVFEVFSEDKEALAYYFKVTD